MYFPPKKDLWHGIVIWGAMLLPVWGVILNRTDFPEMVIYIFAAALAASLWFGTGYTITDNSLKVRNGLLHNKIPYNKIRRVKRTRALWSSAALSLDRVEIKYSYGVTLVSPLDSKTFINELKQRCPEAEFPGL